MLTREEAKTKKCPYTFVPHGIGKHGAFSENCQAENCPKWGDEQDNRQWCSKQADRFKLIYCPKDFGYVPDPYLEEGLNIAIRGYCNQCPHRYGYCGG